MNELVNKWEMKQMVSLRQYTMVAVLFIPYDINTVKVSYKS